MKLRKMRRRAHQKRGFAFGKRCQDYYAGCIICEAWRYYDNNQRWPSFSELQPILQEINNAS
jgi:hypothetical protein